MKSFKRGLFIKILLRFLLTLVIVYILTVVLILLMIPVSRVFVWKGNEPFYPIYRVVADNLFFLLLLAFLVETVVLFVYFWSKPFKYLEEVVRATENIYDSKDQFIELPSDLAELEYQLNQIKMNAIQSNRAAREAEKRKNDLIVYLAHDLKTPLTSVIGYLTLLRDEIQISEELREKYTAISLEKAERLEDLINEFFEITRFNLSSLSLDLSRVNLSRMLEQIAYEFQPMLMERQLECKLDLEEDLIVRLDVNKIQRVFDNLLRNAINYSFDNEIIEISLTSDEYEISIDFTNYGDTISEDKLERIFDQFYRLDTARGSRTGGAGLGLAIAKEIVELHKGTIKVSSKDEVTEFQVKIPML